MWRSRAGTEAWEIQQSLKMLEASQKFKKLWTQDEMDYPQLFIWWMEYLKIWLDKFF